MFTMFIEHMCLINGMIVCTQITNAVVIKSPKDVVIQEFCQNRKRNHSMYIQQSLPVVTQRNTKYSMFNFQ